MTSGVNMSSRILLAIIPPSSSCRRAMGPTAGPQAKARLSVHAVKAEGAAGHHAVLRRRRQADELLPDHVGRAREEPVRVWVVGRPHDLVGADIIGQYPQAALDRLE